MIHKETFRQGWDEGIPPHWVVQYWETKSSTFCEAQYFATAKEAVEFEDTLEKIDDGTCD